MPEPTPHLGMMPAPGGGPPGHPIETPLAFFGGQGPIHVNFWAPDSARFAFVEFELAP
jgi:hypothetical protein